MALVEEHAMSCPMLCSLCTSWVNQHKDKASAIHVFVEVPIRLCLQPTKLCRPHSVFLYCHCGYHMNNQLFLPIDGWKDRQYQYGPAGLVEKGLIPVRHTLCFFNATTRTSTDQTRLYNTTSVLVDTWQDLSKLGVCWSTLSPPSKTPVVYVVKPHIPMWHGCVDFCVIRRPVFSGRHDFISSTIQYVESTIRQNQYGHAGRQKVSFHTLFFVVVTTSTQTSSTLCAWPNKTSMVLRVARESLAMLCSSLVSLCPPHSPPKHTNPPNPHINFWNWNRTIQFIHSMFTYGHVSSFLGLLRYATTSHKTIVLQWFDLVLAPTIEFWVFVLSLHYADSPTKFGLKHIPEW